MTIYIVGDDITPAKRTSFPEQEIREREHLQYLLRRNPEVIAPDTLIVAEEFSDWEDSRRRVDLLGIDKSANLVVVELKRTEDGGHMELQAVRYAAMLSTMTFDGLVKTYAKHLSPDDPQETFAQQELYDFLGWSRGDDETLGEVRIVLAAAEFSKELTSSVLWLNARGLDIRCVRMRPYEHRGESQLERSCRRRPIRFRHGRMWIWGGKVDEPAVERQEGLALSCGPQMQCVGEVHAIVEVSQSFVQQRRTFDEDPG